METNPYAPPKAVVADVTETGLKRCSVLLMIVFTFVTVGLYPPIWFLRRRAALNLLDSTVKLRRWPSIIVIVWVSIQLVLSLVAGPAPRRQSTGELAFLLSRLVQLGLTTLMWIQSIFTKNIPQDHLDGPGDHVPGPLTTNTVKLSSPLTFLLQVFYLQYVINRYIVGPKSSVVYEDGTPASIAAAGPAGTSAASRRTSA